LELLRLLLRTRPRSAKGELLRRFLLAKTQRLDQYLDMRHPIRQQAPGEVILSLLDAPRLWLGLSWLLIATSALVAAENAPEAVFSLNEFSVLTGGSTGDELAQGQRAECQTNGSVEVKAYPSFTSMKPLYGSARFGADYQHPDSGKLYHFALDESKGTGKGYDRFYFDLNQDLNLANDPALPLRQAPAGAQLPWSTLKGQWCYEILKVPFDFGSGDPRPVEILPRLLVWTNDYAAMTFVTIKARRGVIRMGGQRYAAELGHDHVVAGRFDHPVTALRLSSADSHETSIHWWGGDRLTATHKIDGKFYCFAASPTGDRLTVKQYAGDLGLFEVGPGKRTLKKMEVSGSFEGLQRNVPVGGDLEYGSLKPAPHCLLPVGDYLPSYLTFHYGDLQIAVSQNYHSEGKPRDRGGRPPVYGIQLRKDKPFVWDFSNKPDVMFAVPTNLQRFKVGETIAVKAILVDPVLDIMIRGLKDTSRQVTKEFDGPNGTKEKYQQALSLDPNVVITRANGEKVADGVMPFG
jgi:hypothetical protein